MEWETGPKSSKHLGVYNLNKDAIRTRGGGDNQLLDGSNNFRATNELFFVQVEVFPDDVIELVGSICDLCCDYLLIVTQEVCANTFDS